MIEFKQHLSSSKANLYEVMYKGESLIIDCGGAWKRAKPHIFNKNIVGCLLTHEHGDHSKNISKLIERGIDIYSAKETFETCDINSHRANFIESGKTFKVGDFEIYPFSTFHDCKNPLGFYIRAGSETILFATDTATINIKPNSANIIAIECSYSDDLLKQRQEQGKINNALARRLLTSHMSISTTIDYLHKINLSNCREIHLLHLSSDNQIGKSDLKKMFEDEFNKKIVIC